MKKLLKILMLALLYVPSGVWAMKEEEIQIEEPSQQTAEVYFLEYQGKRVKVDKLMIQRCQQLNTMLLNHNVTREKDDDTVTLILSLNDLIDKGIEQKNIKTADILGALSFLNALITGTVDLKKIDAVNILWTMFTLANIFEVNPGNTNPLNALQKELVRRNAFDKPPKEWQQKGVSQKQVQAIEKPTKKAGPKKSKELVTSTKPTNMTHYFITFNKTEFPVSLEVLNQFEIYKIQSQNIEKFGDKETIRVLKKSASLQDLSSARTGGVQSKMKPGTPLKVVWDITHLVEQLFGLEIDETAVSDIKVRESLKQEAYTELSKKYGIDLEDLVRMMLDIATGKKYANNIEDKKELLLVIKIADLLGNKTVMALCSSQLINAAFGSINIPAIRTFQGHTDMVLGVLPLPNNQFLSWTGDNSISLWDLITTKLIHTFEGHTNSVFGVLLLPNNHQFLSWAYDNTIRLWDLNSRKEIRTFSGHTKAVNGVMLLPNNQILSCSNDDTIRLWDLITGKLLHTFLGHTKAVNGSILLPNNHQFLSWSDDGTIRLWNLNTGKLIHTFQGLTGWVRGVLLLPNNQFLSWSNDDADAIRLWNINTGKLIHTFQGHTSFVLGGMLLPNNQFLSWSDDNTFRFWDLNTGKLLHTFQGHTKWVNGVLLLPNNQFLSWSDDKSIRLWNLNTGKLIHTFQGHTNSVRGVTLLPNNQFLSWSSDGTIRLWELAPFANLTFQHIEFIYSLSKQKEPLELKEDSDEYETFISLPQTLQDKIIELKKVKIIKK